ncbi:DUF5996 family protein [Nocardiopsis ansamitocini]|uniref:Ava_C0101 and related proteins n=1 Tax=Nocardiopsis ansamitocini TaxID=1670832 RepID=A0A9W6UKZ4_9ACTN|nr:DUF5996 family protein [Nocardiopsis ansamitocini]GLU50222.1 hypothetical protein Nans01_45730 [Nocardiopsis ansamitocini]
MDAFPDMPFTAWQDTQATVHRFTQIVGKIRLAASPRRNHWWNVPFHLTGRGITTRPMSDGTGVFSIDFDFLDHRLDIATTTGLRYSFSLIGQSVAGFYQRVQDGLAAVGVHVTIERPYPFDLPDADRPFASDTEHTAYDPAMVTRYWQVLSQVNLLLEEFAGRYSGKTSPVHHFWHTFDIAVTRFGDTSVPQSATTDSVTREAYSRDVVSFGFWFGDASFPEAAFYSYTAPEPDGLAEEPLTPDTAAWVERGGSHLAVLRYDEVRTAPDPRKTVLDFYESAYQAGARRAGWDVDRLACTNGITDPELRTRVGGAAAR